MDYNSDSKINVEERNNIVKAYFDAVNEIQRLIEREESRLTREAWSSYLSEDEDINKNSKEELAELLKDHPEYKGKKIVKYRRHEGYGTTSIGILDIEEEFENKDGTKDTRIVPYYIKNLALEHSSMLVDKIVEYNNRKDTSVKNYFYDDINRIFNKSAYKLYDDESKYIAIQRAADRHSTNELTLFMFQNSQKTRVKTGHLTLHYEPIRNRYFTMSRDVRAHAKEDKETTVKLFRDKSANEYSEYNLDDDSEIATGLYVSMFGVIDLLSPGNVGVEITKKEGRDVKVSSVILDHWMEPELSKVNLEDIPGWGQWAIADKNEDIIRQNKNNMYSFLNAPLLDSRYLIPRTSALATSERTKLEKGSEEYNQLAEWEYCIYDSIVSKKLLVRHDPSNPLADADGNMNCISSLYSSIIGVKQQMDLIYQKHSENGAIAWLDIANHIDRAKDIVIGNSLYILIELYNRIDKTAMDDCDKRHFKTKLEASLKDITKEFKAYKTHSVMNWDKLEETFFPSFITKHSKDNLVGGAPPHLPRKGKLYNIDDFMETKGTFVEEDSVENPEVEQEEIKDIPVYEAPTKQIFVEKKLAKTANRRLKDTVAKKYKLPNFLVEPPKMTRYKPFVIEDDIKFEGSKGLGSNSSKKITKTSESSKKYTTEKSTHRENKKKDIPKKLDIKKDIVAQKDIVVQKDIGKSHTDKVTHTIEKTKEAEKDKDIPYKEKEIIKKDFLPFTFQPKKGAANPQPEVNTLFRELNNQQKMRDKRNIPLFTQRGGNPIPPIAKGGGNPIPPIAKGGGNPIPQFTQRGGNPIPPIAKGGGNPIPPIAKGGGNPIPPIAKGGGNPIPPIAKGGGNPIPPIAKGGGNPIPQFTQRGGNPIPPIAKGGGNPIPQFTQRGGNPIPPIAKGGGNPIPPIAKGGENPIPPIAKGGGNPIPPIAKGGGNPIPLFAKGGQTHFPQIAKGGQNAIPKKDVRIGKKQHLTLLEYNEKINQEKNVTKHRYNKCYGHPMNGSGSSRNKGISGGNLLPINNLFYNKQDKIKTLVCKDHV